MAKILGVSVFLDLNQGFRSRLHTHAHEIPILVCHMASLEFPLIIFNQSPVEAVIDV